MKKKKVNYERYNTYVPFAEIEKQLESFVLYSNY